MVGVVGDCIIVLPVGVIMEGDVGDCIIVLPAGVINGR